MKLDIERVLNVSSSHITDETYDKLRNICDGSMIYFPDLNALSIYKKEDFGFWIYVGLITHEELCAVPADLARIVCLAVENGCQWVCLDCDAPDIDGLPMYD